jgi:predicted GIY-YIG superfamily endonuclease
VTGRFDKYVEQLKGLLAELEAAKTFKVGENRLFPTAGGCYAMIERQKYQYVGIAKNIRQRMRNHTSGRAEQSAFAFKLARETTGKVKTYTKVGSKKELMKDSVFIDAMKLATERVKSMDTKFVLIEDPSQRYLFEFFAAMSLDAPYNDFNTH